MKVNIQLEWTPNPSSLKYVTDVCLLPQGALQFTDPKVAKAQSPLAHKLMGLAGVAAVMIGKSFVTITKGEEGEWDELNDAVLATMQKHLDAGEVVVLPEALEGKRAEGGSEVETRIRDILEAEIRPRVMMDGGDITLERFEEGIVYVNMKGACSHCPSSTMTLKLGIEERLRQKIPEVSEVVAL